MQSIYIIKNDKDYTVAAALEKHTAQTVCKNLSATSNTTYTYMEVPFFYEEGTSINIIAPPIAKEYFG